MNTIQVPTSGLTGKALDYAVAKAQGRVAWNNVGEFGAALGWLVDVSLSGDALWVKLKDYTPSTNWAQGGPLIEQYGVEFGKESRTGPFIATLGNIVYAIECGGAGRNEGSTHLIAAMRTIVMAELGPTVDIPREFI